MAGWRVGNGRREAEAMHISRASKYSSYWGKTAMLIHFAAHMLFGNTVINCYQSWLWDGRLQGRFGWSTGLGFGTSLAV